MKRKNMKNVYVICLGIVFTILLFSFIGCVGIGEKGSAIETLGGQSSTESGKWTWVSGDSETGRRGVYGTLGSAAGANKPGARSDAVSWVDSEDNLWLFGGYGFANKRISQYLNDLWKFDGKEWTWVSGDNSGNEPSVFGARGVTGISGKPGGRRGAVSWIDRQGNLWLFGGYGYTKKWYAEYLNDLWKFDGTNWTWISGECEKDQPGVYGSKGIAESSNQPGGRNGAVSWTDSEGNLWLFGGYGYDRYGAEGYLNDLWKFDGTNWIWISGDNTHYEIGDYGTRGIAAGTSKPGARGGSVGWIDSGDNLWLFGGHGNANISWTPPDITLQNPGTAQAGYLNDLWKFDGTNWTWISGDSKAFHSPQIASETVDSPAARNGGVCWFDAAGNLWIFGGDADVRFTKVTNDLWKYDGTNWVRIYGAVSHKDRQGVYGTRGVATETNRPGSRANAVSWVDSNGTLWLFGGEKPFSANSNEYFNDLWKFEP